MEIPLGSKLLWKDGSLAYVKVECNKGGFWWESLDPKQQEKEQWERTGFRVPDEDLLNSPYYSYGDNSRFNLFVNIDMSSRKPNVCEKDLQDFEETMKSIDKTDVQDISIMFSDWLGFYFSCWNPADSTWVDSNNFAYTNEDLFNEFKETYMYEKDSIEETKISEYVRLDKSTEDYFNSLRDYYDVDDELTGYLVKDVPYKLLWHNEMYIAEVTGAETFVENGHEELEVKYFKLFAWNTEK